MARTHCEAAWPGEGPLFDLTRERAVAVSRVGRRGKTKIEKTNYKKTSEHLLARKRPRAPTEIRASVSRELPFAVARHRGSCDRPVRNDRARDDVPTLTAVRVYRTRGCPLGAREPYPRSRRKTIFPRLRSRGRNFVLFFLSRVMHRKLRFRCVWMRMTLFHRPFKV